MSCLRFNGIHNRTTALQETHGADPGDGLACNIITNQAKRLYFYKVYITENTINFFGNVLPFYLVPFLGNSLIIRNTIENKLPYPFNPCEDRDENYHQANCHKQCMVQLIANKCNCSFKAYYMSLNRPRCSAVETNECYEPSKTPFNDECNVQCPASCKATKYSVTQKTKDDGLEKQNLTNFLIYFDDLDVHQLIQVPKVNQAAFASSIGGSMGLFLGMSLFSFVEVLELAVVIFFILIGKSN